jgi:hypothetical protein
MRIASYIYVGYKPGSGIRGGFPANSSPVPYREGCSQCRGILSLGATVIEEKIFITGLGIMISFY